MNTSSPTLYTRDALIAAVAEIGDLAPTDISGESRLVEDLGLDSIALAEVVAYLIVDWEMESVAADLEERDWASVTIDAICREYRSRGRTSR